MNKILLDENAINYTRFLILDESIKYPTEEKERIEFCEALFNKLKDSKQSKQLYISRQVKHGILISLIEHDKIYYLSHCFRDEWGFYTTTIYADTNLLQQQALAKFLKDNLKNIKKEYVQMSKERKRIEKKNKSNLLDAESKMNNIIGQA